MSDEPLHLPPGRAVFVRTDADAGLVVGSGRELARAIFETTSCPACGQTTGSRCVTKSGRRSGRFHMARFYRFWDGTDLEPMALMEEDD